MEEREKKISAKKEDSGRDLKKYLEIAVVTFVTFCCCILAEADGHTAAGYYGLYCGLSAESGYGVFRKASDALSAAEGKK